MSKRTVTETDLQAPASDGSLDTPNPEKESIVTLLKDFDYFLSRQPSLKDRLAEGKKMREECPRADHGLWKPSKNRPDPLTLLAAQDKSRIPHLIPLRYGRMMQSPFSFFRGAALIMASDLSPGPRTKALAQLCGDCHLLNFGIFATPERNVIFDLNDFDETLPGPFEWDLKRLAASFVVAAEHNGFTESVAARCVRAIARTYRLKMDEFSQMKTLDIWYDRVNFDDMVTHIKKPGRRKEALTNLSRLKEKRSHAGAVAKLTEVVNGQRRIRDNPPLIVHPEIATAEAAKEVLQKYAATLWPSKQRLLQRFRFLDVAMKVVGVGSVGTLACIVLLQGEGGDDDNIFLQVKEATPSVLEGYIGKSQFEHSGARIVNGQRILQAASDMFLGWTAGPIRNFYVRQLMDVKASVPVDELDATTLEQYGEVCAHVLARGHARSGDPTVIYGYLGKGETFDEALTKFALSYARQNQRDFESLLEAINKGKIAVAPGL